MGSWAFSWVQIIGHNKKGLGMLWSLLSLFLAAGCFFLTSNLGIKDIALFFAGLFLISATVGVLLESPKIALLQLGLSLYVMLMSLGALGWLGLEIDTQTLLAMMVLLTVVSSNLVHVLSTLAREMARGLFQFDAIAEALKLNTSPIFLSNLTTGLGFMALFWVDESYQSLISLVSIGVTISFVVMLSWVPLILQSWLLEFRVGNTRDRHGLTSLAKKLQEFPKARLLLLVTGFAVALILILWHWKAIPVINELLILLAIFSLLFWLAWSSLSLALLNLFMNVLALVVALSVFLWFFEQSPWLGLLWLAPLGIIVDDGIHFFSRYSRAKYSVFSNPHDSVIYAMASVGRPIWITSWVLIAGMTVLLFSGHELIQQAALLTIFAIVGTAILVLLILPAFLMTKQS